MSLYSGTKKQNTKKLYLLGIVLVKWHSVDGRPPAYKFMHAWRTTYLNVNVC